MARFLFKPQLNQANERVTIRINRRSFKGVLGLFLIFGLTAAGAFLYRYWIEHNAPRDIPIIRPHDGPLKIRPQQMQPQTMHQDKQVYERLAPSSQVQREEKLRPLPERPLPEFMDGAQSAEAPVEEGLRDFAEVSAIPNYADPNVHIVHDPKPLPPLALTQGQEASEDDVDYDVSVEVQKADRGYDLPKHVRKSDSDYDLSPKARKDLKHPPTPKNTSLPRKVARIGTIDRTGKGNRVQVASYRTHERAEQALSRLVKKYPSLGKINYRIIRADMGPKKGVQYHLQLGPLQKRQSAISLRDLLHKYGIKAYLLKAN